MYMYHYHFTLLQFAYLVKKIVTDLDPLHLSGCRKKRNHCQADMIKKISFESRIIDHFKTQQKEQHSKYNRT